MTRRRLLLIASLPLAVGVALVVLAMLPPRPGVTRANFDRIKEGMQLEEVEEIFGGPGHRLPIGAGGVHSSVSPYSWRSEDGATAVIWIESPRSAVLGSKEWTDSTESLVQKIRRWLHLD